MRPRVSPVTIRFQTSPKAAAHSLLQVSKLATESVADPSESRNRNLVILVLNLVMLLLNFNQPESRSKRKNNPGQVCCAYADLLHIRRSPHASFGEAGREI